MSKNTNLSFLTDYITADITNGRIGINTPSPTVAFDVTGVAKFSSSVQANGVFRQYAGAGYYSDFAYNGTTYNLGSSETEDNIDFKIAGGGAFTTGGKFRWFTQAGGATPVERFSISSTGAATFSGEIKSGDTITLGAAAVGGFWTWGSTTAYLVAGTGKALNLNPNGTSGTTGLSIATTGAATFSSSVQIGSTLNNSLSVGSAAPTTDTLNQIFAGQAAFGGQNSAGGETDIGHNWYYYSGWKYRFTSSSSNIKLNGDVISFERAASGTANAAITFSESMRITSGGNVYIGLTSSGTNKFAISAAGTVSDLYVTSSGGVGSYSLGTGIVYSNGGVLTSTSPSDSRLKTDIKDISYGLSDILKLKPVSYNWLNDSINQGIQFGFIAQDVQSVMPDAIKEFGDDIKYLGLEKDAIYATLVKAIQELSAEITLLKNK